MSPSILKSFSSDQTLRDQFASELTHPGPFKRVKVFHDSPPSSDADSVGTAAGASSCASGDDPETLPRQDLRLDADRALGPDDHHSGLMIADQRPPPANSEASPPPTPDLVADEEFRFLPGSTKLRRLLERSDRIIVCPGVFDGFSARVAMSVGFEGLYMVSAPFEPQSPPDLRY